MVFYLFGSLFWLRVIPCGILFNLAIDNNIIIKGSDLPVTPGFGYYSFSTTRTVGPPQREPAVQHQHPFGYLAADIATVATALRSRRRDLSFQNNSPAASVRIKSFTG